MNLFRTVIDFKICGDNISRLLNVIFQKRLTCRNLVNQGNSLTGSCTKSVWKILLYECEKLGLEAEIRENTSIFHLFKWLSGRKGIIAGFAAGFIMVTILSNTLLQLRVKCDNKEVYDALEDYLKSKGITYGCFIPKLDLYSLELNILQDVEEISWVGIYPTGGTLNIDVVEAVEKPEYNQQRLPSNLVASADGQIVSYEVYSGKPVVQVGSGVHKGQVLVSGQITLKEATEDQEEEISFRRSQGKVFAQVNIEESFYCPFESEEKIYSDESITKNYFGLYNLDIPLSLEKTDGLYSSEEKSNKLTFLGLELPLSYKTVEYTPYSFKTVTLTKEQAEEKVYKLAENYEKNFLTDDEITVLEQTEEIIYDENGVTLKKNYVVIENIAQEKEFLVK